MVEPEGLRQRRAVEDRNGDEIVAKRPKETYGDGRAHDEQEEDESLTLTDIGRMLIGVALLSCLASFAFTQNSFLWGWKPWFTRPNAVMSWLRGPIYLTDAELAGFDGSDPKRPILLALNGTIYDVTSAREIYGQGGSYHVFAGKDAARGFVTGCFAEDATPDLRGAEWTYIPTDVPAFGQPATSEQKVTREREVRRAKALVAETIEGWQRMFEGRTGKNYFEVGKVVREEGWLEKLPLRPLCAAAEAKRPQPDEKVADAGRKYRGG